ncbi:MAG: glycosyltransferase [Mariprofundales bacterium]|nr:glycosyltransferase [Mariprofundales bacterium]
MRIAHVITRMDRGGSAINTLVTATEQAESGETVMLLCGASRESNMSPQESRAVEEGVSRFVDVGGVVVVVAELYRAIGWADVVALRQLRARLRKFHPDVVHTHTSKSGVLGRLAALRLGARVVHTPHGHVFHGYFSPLKTRLFIWLERVLAHATTSLIALTRAERDDHLQLHIGRSGQWHVVPSGVAVESIAERVTHLRSTGEQQPLHAISVGRLTPIKGMDRLLYAWCEVVKREPQAQLTIVGDGELRDELIAQSSQLGVATSVHFAGWDDPVPWLAKGDRFILLSRNEGMGRAVVEAFAAGLPCIVADVCGLAELVDGSVGAVVDGDDASAVATAVIASYDCQAALQRRAQLYSVAAMVTAIGRIYESD